MSVRYELAEFYDNALDRSQDFGFQVADTARRGLCNLWSNLPGALIPNPGDSFRRGALSALCQDFPPPSAPALPYAGGQCATAYRVNSRRQFTQISTGQQVNQSLQSAPITGPLSAPFYRTEGDRRILAIRDGSGAEVVLTFVNNVTNDIQFMGVESVVRVDGRPDNCGNPEPRFTGGDRIDDRDTIIEGDTIVEGDRNIDITLDFSPTFEDDVCIGTAVFCVDVEGNRVRLDLGGVTVDFSGGGQGQGGGSIPPEVGDQITNIDNRTTIIRQTQEECCAEIIAAISSFRNRATELFNEGELRDACIVGLIRNNTRQIPRFEGPVSERARGSSGINGVTLFVQPLRPDSCFLVIDVEVTNAFRGRLYNLREESSDVEGGFGNAQVCFFDGGVRPAAAAGLRVIYARRTLIRFDDISSGNQVRVSLKGGLNYSIVDPGFRWRPSSLPQCEELVDPPA